MQVCPHKHKFSTQAGATLVNAMVAMAIFGVAAVSLFAGISFSFSTVQSAREELRANQILVEKMETIRLYHWGQINTPGFVPTNFTAFYFPPHAARTNGVGAGLIYNGFVTIGPGPADPTYSEDLRTVTVGLQWQTGDRTVRQSVTSLVSKNGLQRYIY